MKAGEYKMHQVKKLTLTKLPRYWSNMFDIGSRQKRAIGQNKTCKFLPITITKLSQSTIT